MTRNPEGSREEEPQVSEEQEKRAQALMKFHLDPIVKKNESCGKEEEQEIKKYYDTLSPRERAEALYSKVPGRRTGSNIVR